MRMPFLVFLALAVPVPAVAELPPSQSGQAAYARFKALDTDMDRRVSRGELMMRGRERASETLFQMLDVDADGRLAGAELRPAAARLRAYDSNGDGEIGQGEFPATLDHTLFATLDGDGDGAVELRDLRPEFAGWRPPEPPAAAPHAQSEQAPDARPYCWVPVVEGDGWWLVAPVTSTTCRLSP